MFDESVPAIYAAAPQRAARAETVARRERVRAFWRSNPESHVPLGEGEFLLFAAAPVKEPETEQELLAPAAPIVAIPAREWRGKVI